KHPFAGAIRSVGLGWKPKKAAGDCRSPKRKRDTGAGLENRKFWSAAALCRLSAEQWGRAAVLCSLRTHRRGANPAERVSERVLRPRLGLGTWVWSPAFRRFWRRAA